MNKCFVVFCHPSKDSFTAKILDTVIDYLNSNNIQWKLSDLYSMNFISDMSEQEYQREVYCNDNISVSNDVLEEQDKIQWADYILFIFPLFWNDVPAKLKGWFDRVWTYGFAYGNNVDESGNLLGGTMTQKEKIYFLCSCGNPETVLKQNGKYDAIRKTLLVDRIYNRAKEKDVILFGNMSREEVKNLSNNAAVNINKLKILLNRLFADAH